MFVTVTDNNKPGKRELLRGFRVEKEECGKYRNVLDKTSKEGQK